MTPWPLALAFVAPIAGRLADRVSAGILGGIGLAALCCGLLAMSLLRPDASALDIVWRMALCGVGYGFFQSPNNRAIVGSAPMSRAGGASGMLGTARLLGQSLGAALVAVIFSSGGGAHEALLLAAAMAGAGMLASVMRMPRLLDSVRSPIQDASSPFASRLAMRSGSAGAGSAAPSALRTAA